MSTIFLSLQHRKVPWLTTWRSLNDTRPGVVSVYQVRTNGAFSAVGDIGREVLTALGVYKLKIPLDATQTLLMQLEAMAKFMTPSAEYLFVRKLHQLCQHAMLEEADIVISFSDGSTNVK
jgi:hypothetical protein